MDKEFYDKYGKELDCKSCIGLQECSTNSNIPLCDKGYRRFAKDKIADLETELAEKDKEIERLCNDCNKLWLSREQTDVDRMKAEINQTQLAIQELEKVKEELDKEIIIMSNFDDMKNQLKYLVEISVYIQQRLKKLKGK